MAYLAPEAPAVEFHPTSDESLRLQRQSFLMQQQSLVMQRKSLRLQVLGLAFSSVFLYLWLSRR